ncbi:unnamed protein product [Toxocara canis]|uniref:Nucleoside-diphosphate kinase n=1 Tax=Toxocara canis TaxID=6265 RepID=A0A183VGF5_TOXCA|nr:unnamed protein product [Toxocara canis]
MFNIDPIAFGGMFVLSPEICQEEPALVFDQISYFLENYFHKYLRPSYFAAKLALNAKLGWTIGSSEMCMFGSLDDDYIVSSEKREVFGELGSVGVVDDVVFTFANNPSAVRSYGLNDFISHVC